MIAVAGAVLLSALALSAVVTIALPVYLDARLHALKQSGDLPVSTPQLFGFSRSWAGWGQTINLPLLYSRRYREIDDHIRLFVPIVRITLPLIPLLFLAVGLT